MIHLSELSVCMSKLDRKNQQLCWYDNRVRLCTKVTNIAMKIKNECKRRGLKCRYFRSGGARHRRHNIRIGKSLETFNKNYRNYMVMIVCLH